MKKSNWLYCLSETKQKITINNHVGYFWYEIDDYDESDNFILTLEREDVDEFTFDENLQYALGRLGMINKYCDAFFNVSEKEFDTAIDQFNYKLMILIDSNRKRNVIKRMAKELFWQWYSLEYPTSDDDIKQLEKEFKIRNAELRNKIRGFCIYIIDEYILTISTESRRQIKR